jgi:hypothetical protein
MIFSRINSTVYLSMIEQERCQTVQDYPISWNLHSYWVAGHLINWRERFIEPKWCILIMIPNRRTMRVRQSGIRSESVEGWLELDLCDPFKHHTVVSVYPRGVICSRTNTH